MLLRTYGVRLNICTLCLISFVAGTWIYLVFRIDYPNDKELFTQEDILESRHLTVSDNSVHKGYKMNQTKLLNGKLLTLKSTKGSLFASHKNSLLRPAVDQPNAKHITTYNDSLQKNNQNSELELLHDRSTTDNLNAVRSNPIYPLFQSAEEEEFPTLNRQLPRIPHIIHQMYVDEMIPEMYINHVKSFIKHNPTWEYRFWTDESGRRLLQKHHPYLVKVYDDFGSSVKRSDLLRYAVLYEFGGFYADLDMDNLRPLNITTMKYACIVPFEPFEHSYLLNNMDFLMNNAIMSCRAKHPFFKLLLSGLRSVDPSGYPVGTTGPGYVTRKFIKYNHISLADADRNKTDWTSNSPYFYKGELREDDNNSVYVPNSQYFMDKLDPIHVKEDGKFTQLCKSIETLSSLNQRACSEFYTREPLRINKKYTFTVHHWYHLWEMKTSSVNELKKINISDIVSNCVLYNG